MTPFSPSSTDWLFGTALSPPSTLLVGVVPSAELVFWLLMPHALSKRAAAKTKMLDLVLSFMFLPFQIFC
jgi:hypothetical protein